MFLFFVKSYKKYLLKIQALAELVHTACRCNGVSGSCTIRICWTTLPTFRAVGNRLASRYSAARTSRQVIPLRGGDRAKKARVLVLKSSKRPNKKPRRSDLVYLDPSPNYCDYNLLTGVLGTGGRPCNRTNEEGQEGGCPQLCCGRGYVTREYHRTWQCNCTFNWCCTVTCKQCSETTELYTCS